ncbi:MAG: helix-hairpin-helix domain-containing protein [Deltaproteobacteria bacterium]|nr:helix-hairpin-helix domain-containing protein [Deltaproteobacteria bacterium]
MAVKMCHINRSSADDISKFSGIRERDAQKLIDYRDSHGPFKDWNEIDDVPGFGDVKLNKLKSECDLD